MLESRSCTWQHGQSATTVSAPASTASCSRCPPRTGATGYLADEREHRAAAQALLAVVLHLDELDAGNRLEQVARRLVVALRAAHVARVVERDRRALERVLLELEPAVGERRRDELGVVLDLELVLLAALGGEVRVELLPHETARRARGDDGLRAALPGLGDVVLVDLLEQVPLAGDLHRDAAARLVLAHVRDLVARVGEQAHAASAMSVSTKLAVQPAK